MSEEMTIYTGESGAPMGLEGYKPAPMTGRLKRVTEDGTIEYSLNGERKPEWDVIFINAWYSRALFTEFGEGAKPDCKTTIKTLQPEALEGDVYGWCEKCPNNQWTKDEDGKSKPPKCGLTLNFAGFLDSGRTQPFIVAFSGLGLKEAQKVLQYHYDNKKALFEISYKLGVGELQKRGATMWRNWVITSGANLTEANEALVAELATEYQNQASRNKLLPGQDSAESLAEGVTAEDVAGMMGGTIVEEGVTEDNLPDFLKATPKQPTQEELVKKGTIPFVG